MPWVRIRKFLRPLRRLFHKDRNRFLNRVAGVVHVGANVGQEREDYRRRGLRVLWVEPIPEVFARLQANIAGLPEQRAMLALVTDVDGGQYVFHVSNNDGASSSILDLKLHKDVWPAVEYSADIVLESVSLPSLFARAGLDSRQYQALVLDTQGSELMVLRGSLPLLGHFRFIKIEVPDFEAYAGCCQLADVAGFMAQNGFRERSRHAYARRAQGGSYYDVVYERKRWPGRWRRPLARRDAESKRCG
jgi:FkbM family methyltransferase